MTEVKLFEVRDRNTFLVCFGMWVARNRLSSSDRKDMLIWRAGYGGEGCVLFGKLDGGRTEYDGYNWDDRTMKNAHLYVKNNWNALKSGDLIDVQYILKETEAPVDSEILV